MEGQPGSRYFSKARFLIEAIAPFLSQHSSGQSDGKDPPWLQRMPSAASTLPC